VITATGHCRACGFQTKLDPQTAAYHRVHRENHLAAFPSVDAETRRNLDMLVSLFEMRAA
jgi:hypothetical protein